MSKSLGLTEEFILLALSKNKRGLFQKSRNLLLVPCVLLIELIIGGEAHLEKNKRLYILRSKPSCIKFKEVLIEIICKNKPKKLQGWVSYFSNHPFQKRKIYNLAMESLIENGNFEIETGGTGSALKYEVKLNSREKVIQKIRMGLLSDEKTDDNTLVLTLILMENRLLKPYFSPEEWKAVKSKLELLKNHSLYNNVRTIGNRARLIEFASSV